MDGRQPGPQDACGDIRVRLDSSTPCWNDAIEGFRFEPTAPHPASYFSKERTTDTKTGQSQRKPIELKSHSSSFVSLRGGALRIACSIHLRKNLSASTVSSGLNQFARKSEPARLRSLRFYKTEQRTAPDGEAALPG